MNILIYSFDFHPCPGGVNTFLDGLIRGLRKKGHVVDFLNSSHMSFLPKKAQFDIQRYKDSALEYFPNVPEAVRNIEILRYANEELVKSIDVSRYDIVHSNNGVTSQIIHSLYPSLPLIGTIHGNYYEESIHNNWVKNDQEAQWMKVYDEYAVEYPTLVHTVSEAMLEVLPTIPSEKHIVIPNGVEIERYKPNFLNNSPVKIASSGIINERKGYDLLIEAIKALKEEGINEISVTLFGDGPMKETLEEESKSYNLPISFPGYIEQGVLLEELPKYDIFVHPSRFESFGLSVTEAMASGCAVICTNIGGLKEQIIHEENGLLFQLNQASELIECLKRLIKNVRLRENLRKRAVETVRDKFSLNALINQFEKAYLETIKIHSYKEN